MTRAERIERALTRLVGMYPPDGMGDETRIAWLEARSALAPESGQGEPDPKVLEITERDRWAWRLGWATAMSERTGRTFNPSDAPEPPATSSPSSAQGEGCPECRFGYADDYGTICPYCQGKNRQPSRAGGGA